MKNNSVRFLSKGTLFNWALAFTLLAWGLFVSGCSSATDPEKTHQTRQSLNDPGTSRLPVLPSNISITLPWGQDHDSVALHTPSGPEGALEGPSDLFAHCGGALVVLDRFNQRTVAVDRGGNLHELAKTPEDSEHVEMGPDHSLGVYSRFQSKIWLFEPTGKPAGEILVPRQIRGIRGFTLAPSRRVTVHTAFQSRFSLGSPNAKLPVFSTLSSMQDGIFPDSKNRGIAALLTKGELRIFRFSPKTAVKGQNREHERREILLSIKEELSSARIVGQVDDMVCLKLEKARSVTKGASESSREVGTVSVDREALCVQKSTGQTLLRQSLPQVGLYLPRRELVMGTNPLRIVHMQPTRKGLVIRGWEIPNGAETNSARRRP